MTIAGRIENFRAATKAALHAGDMEQAMFYVRIIVGLQLCAGEFDVKLKPVSKKVKTA